MIDRGKEERKERERERDRERERERERERGRSRVFKRKREEKCGRKTRRTMRGEKKPVRFSKQEYQR